MPAAEAGAMVSPQAEVWPTGGARWQFDSACPELGEAVLVVARAADAQVRARMADASVHR